MPTTNGATAADAGTVEIGGDITVNRLGFGAMRITGRGIWGDPPDRTEARTVLRRAVELGVNFIDTADSYGPKVSEELIAEALYPYPDNLVIATKGGLLRPGAGRWDPDGRPEYLRQACEGSLRRLRLDQIPLYQFHRPDPAVSLEDSIGALVALKDEGKIRHIGLSNVNEDQLRRAQALTPIVSITATTQATAHRTRLSTSANRRRLPFCHGRRSRTSIDCRRSWTLLSGTARRRTRLPWRGYWPGPKRC